MRRGARCEHPHAVGGEGNAAAREARTVRQRRRLHGSGRHGPVERGLQQQRSTARTWPASRGGDDAGLAASAACAREAAHGITTGREAWASVRRAPPPAPVGMPRWMARRPSAVVPTRTRGNHPSCRQGESPPVDCATGTRRCLDGRRPSHAVKTVVPRDDQTLAQLRWSIPRRLGDSLALASGERIRLATLMPSTQFTCLFATSGRYVARRGSGSYRAPQRSDSATVS